MTVLITLKPSQYGHHFADDIFKFIFMYANCWILIKISMELVLNRFIGNKPLSESIIT